VTQPPATAEQEEVAPTPEEGVIPTTEPGPEDDLTASAVALDAEPGDADVDAGGDDVTDEVEVPPARAHDLLEELVGHEIATRLHARYSEIISRVHRIPENHPQRAAWEARAEALNPDNWVTPNEVLRGVSHADALFDALRRELLAH
jgi:hypothetical protein